MMLNLFILVSLLVAAVYSASLAELEGTWTTKSEKVLTGSVRETITMAVICQTRVGRLTR